MHSPDVICIGGATLDRKYRLHAPMQADTSNPATGAMSFGGVARNVCETLRRLGVSAGLMTLVGADDSGRALVDQLKALGADVSLVSVLPDHRTAEYVAVLGPDRSLAVGLADMAIFDAFTVDHLEGMRPHLESARWLFADCNLPAPVLVEVIRRAQVSKVRLAVDPVSVAKAARLPADLSGIDLLVLNRREAAAVLGGDSDPATASRKLLARGAAAVVLTDGAEGMLASSGGEQSHVPSERVEVKDVTGAGDALIAAVIAGLLAGHAPPEAVRTGARIAALTVASGLTVRDDLTPQLLQRSPA
jgi:pseudouridine kinase